MTRPSWLDAVRRPRFILLAALPVALGLVLGTTGCAKKGQAPGKTLVTTGSRRLTVEQFEEYARDPQVVQPYTAMPESAQKQALFDDILSYELLAEAGTRAGFDKDSTYTQIEKKALPQLLPDALYDKHIGSAVKVSEAEAKLFYEGQKNEHRMAVILAPDEATAKTVETRLGKGEKFADVAKALSQDPGTAPNGGEIPGWLAFGQLPPDIEKALEPLKVGEHTGPIQQRTGTYFFALLESRPRKDSPPFEQNKQGVISLLENRKKSALVDSYLLGLKKQYGLKTDGPGWTVLNDKMLVLPDSLSRLLPSDPHKAGMTDADLGQVVASWTGKNYTVKDLISDINSTPMNERPASNNVNMVKMFIEGKAMNEILVTEATKEGLADSPKVHAAIERTRSAYLVNKYIEKTLPVASVGFPSAAELDSTTQAMMSASGAGASHKVTFQQLPPQIQQQIVQDWQGKRRQAMLKTEVARLKAEIKPVVDETAFKAIPWPVPADEKEKA